MTSFDPSGSPSERRAPALPRRLACFVYEGVLLFGVLMIAGWLFSALSQQRHALQGRSLLQAFLFVVLGIYFTWFWSHGGQTLAMKTWRLQVVTQAGEALTQARAFARYLASWVWLLPALVVGWSTGLDRNGWAISLLLAGGVVGYALTALARPDRQCWHDVLCGTRVVDRSTPIAA